MKTESGYYMMGAREERAPTAPGYTLMKIVRSKMGWYLRVIKLSSRLQSFSENFNKKWENIRPQTPWIKLSPHFLKYWSFSYK